MAVKGIAGRPGPKSGESFRLDPLDVSAAGLNLLPREQVCSGRLSVRSFLLVICWRLMFFCWSGMFVCFAVGRTRVWTC